MMDQVMCASAIYPDLIRADEKIKTYVRGDQVRSDLIGSEREEKPEARDAENAGDENVPW